MIVRFVAYLCDADRSHTIMSRFLRRLVTVETLSKLSGNR